MIDPQLQALIRDVSDSADDTGRRDGHTVVDKEVIAALKAYTVQASQSDFVKSSGSECPFCQSVSVYRGHLGLALGVGKRACICNDCEGTWNEVYGLSGYTVLASPSPR